MRKEEINRIIAEYMGIDLTNVIISEHNFIFKDGDNIISSPYLYTFSLDSLVPVWKKLDNSRVDLFINSIPTLRCVLWNEDCDKASISSLPNESVQFNAAYATAKAIQQLE